MWNFEYESLKEIWCRFFTVDREDVASVLLNIVSTHSATRCQNWSQWKPENLTLCNFCAASDFFFVGQGLRPRYVPSSGPLGSSSLGLFVQVP
jgi:hypothetical protein